MEYQTVNYSVQAGIATVELNRPEVRNAFNNELRSELQQALQRVARDPEARVVLLTGAGKGFCSGADLSTLGTVSVVENLVVNYKDMIGLIGRMEKPVIAAIEGAAAGIGAAFALAADLSVMAEDASLVQAFSNVGLVPDGGICWHLVQELGYKRAYQLIIEAERLPAARCLELGLTNRVVPAGSALEEARAWAGELLQRPPLSLSFSKQVLRDAVDLSLDQTIVREAEYQHRAIGSEDFREGVAAFREKRKPVFRGC
jgi:2-(1,2-epoxy-1,2-dihydrophenyl)acetyl-CoA isomerase